MHTLLYTIFFLSFAICVYHLCFIFSPLFHGFTLIPIPQSMFSPYPPILTLLPIFNFIMSLLYPLVFTILHISPLLPNLCVYSLCSLDLPFLTSHQNPPQTPLSLIIFEWKVAILLGHAQQAQFFPLFDVQHFSMVQR